MAFMVWLVCIVRSGIRGVLRGMRISIVHWHFAILSTQARTTSKNTNPCKWAQILLLILTKVLPPPSLPLLAVNIRGRGTIQCWDFHFISFQTLWLGKPLGNFCRKGPKTAQSKKATAFLIWSKAAKARESDGHRAAGDCWTTSVPSQGGQNEIQL